MGEDWEIEYKENLKKAEGYLKKAEKLLQDNSNDGLLRNLKLKKSEKIKIPNGHIRTADDFRSRYELVKLISRRDLRSNIAYALQGCDLLNYFHYRFNITLSAGSVFLRLSIVHVFSIIEALMSGYLDSLHDECLLKDNKVCKRNQTCDFYLKKAGNYSFRERVELLIERDIIAFSDLQIKELMELKDIRDRLHLWNVDGNEFLDDKFSKQHYDQALHLLVFVRNSLIERGTVYVLQIEFCDAKINFDEV